MTHLYFFGYPVVFGFFTFSRGCVEVTLFLIAANTPTILWILTTEMFKSHDAFKHSWITCVFFLASILFLDFIFA